MRKRGTASAESEAISAGEEGPEGAPPCTSNLSCCICLAVAGAGTDLSLDAAVVDDLSRLATLAATADFAAEAAEAADAAEAARREAARSAAITALSAADTAAAFGVVSGRSAAIGNVVGGCAATVTRCSGVCTGCGSSKIVYSRLTGTSQPASMLRRTTGSSMDRLLRMTSCGGLVLLCSSIRPCVMTAKPSLRNGVTNR